jgi:3-(3-hydroxy-phenyl)propionate hydroxylase
VTSTLQTEAGSKTVRTRFVVGCDGAGSAIRGAMGARLFDYAFDEPWLVLDAVADAPLEMPDGVMQFCDPQRPATYMRMGARRHRWEFMIKPGEDAAALLAPARLGALLAPFAPMERLTIERQAVYRFHGLLAEQWRCGRVLIAGDAAHQMPPFAGQGMCAAIRDSANLAWKLAWIIRGRAGMGLLDSYQQERAPHVRVIVERAIAMGRVVCLLDPVAAAARDAEMLARKAAGAEEISLAMPDLTAGLLTATAGAGGLFPQFVVDGVWLDDVLGAGPWLIGAVPAAAAGIGGCWTLEADTLAPFAGALRAWLAGHAAPAVLVRPDRVVFGTGAADGLIAQWEQMLM